MAEVLLSRYDLFVSNKMLTHVTTNLNSEELEGIYGNRIRSRMREMFNLIYFVTNKSFKLNICVMLDNKQASQNVQKFGDIFKTVYF